MGKILKTKNLTTLAEGVIVTLGIAVICTGAYFLMPTNKGIENGNAVNAVDSTQTSVTQTPVAQTPVAQTPVTQTPVKADTVTTVVSVPVAKKTKSVAKSNREKSVSTAKSVKESKTNKNDGSRNNLDIQF